MAYGEIYVFLFLFIIYAMRAGTEPVQLRVSFTEDELVKRIKCLRVYALGCIGVCAGAEPKAGNQFQRKREICKRHARLRISLDI